MQFLSPWFLAGALAVAIPVWVHLIRREQSERVPFSSLMFVRRVPIKSVYRRHLKHLLLLSVRVLMILLIALAFARPFFPQGNLAGAHRSGERRALILLDTSLSMQQGNRWARALEAARDVISRLGERDDAQIVTFGADFQIENLPTNDKAALRTTLAGLKPTASTTSYEHAFRAIEHVKADTDRPLSVTLISDMQKAGLSKASQGLAVPSVAEFSAVSVADEDTPNWTVQDVRIRPQVFGARYPERLRVEVRGYATPEASKDVVLSLTGRVLQRKTVQVPASGVAAVEFDPFEVPIGSNRGEVKILPPDELSADDAFEFTLERREPYRLLFLREPGDDAELYYFRNALGAESNSPWVIEPRGPAESPSLPVSSYALVVLSNLGDIPAPLAPQLRSLVEKGGGLLITLGNRAPSPDLEQRLKELWPAKALEKRLLTRDQDRLVLLGQFERNHPVFRELEEEGAQSLRTVRVFGYVRTEPQGSVLMRFANGDPALIERDFDRGRVLLLTSPLDNVWNDFPLHPVFIPLTHQLVRYAANLPDQPAYYRIPSTVSLSTILGSAAGTLNAGSWSAVGPNGERQGPLDQERRADYLWLREPGFYEVRDRNGSHLVAANPDPQESDLTQIPKEDRALWVAGAQAEAANATAMSSTASEKRQSIWWSLLLLALTVGAFEIYLANPFLATRKTASPTEVLRESSYVKQ